MTTLSNKELQNGNFEMADIKGDYYEAIFDEKKHKLKAHLVICDQDKDDSYLIENCVECNILDIKNIIAYDSLFSNIQIKTRCLIHVFDESVKACFENSSYVRDEFDSWFEISNFILDSDFNGSGCSVNEKGDQIGVVANLALDWLCNIDISIK